MGDFLVIPCLNCIKITQKQAWQSLIYFAWMKSIYFREYICRFSRKSHYFCILGVSHLKHSSTRGPIPLWLCVPHVHWCRDCETVPEQHWNKPETVSQSQCTPPQSKKISFGIRNEGEVQGQSSPELTGILTHWGRDKMDATSQTTLSNAFLEWKCFNFD